MIARTATISGLQAQASVIAAALELRAIRQLPRNQTIPAQPDNSTRLLLLSKARAQGATLMPPPPDNSTTHTHPRACTDLPARTSTELRLRLGAVPRHLTRKSSTDGGAVKDSVSSVSELCHHQIVSFRGLLVLEESGVERTHSPAGLGLPALKALLVQGSLCLSHVSLPEPNIELGKIGYNDGWRDVSFSFELTNESELTTRIQVHGHVTAM